MAAASIFDLLGKITGYNFPITAKRIKKFNTSTVYMSDKIRKAGFSPPIELSEGLRRMAEWYLNGGRNAQQMRQKDEEGES
jgi:nucleoside-diphosphate-sugar epimerase